MQFSPQKQKFIDTATGMFGGGSVISKQQVRDASEKAGIPLARWFMKKFRTGYNQFELPTEGGSVTPVLPVTQVQSLHLILCYYGTTTRPVLSILTGRHF